MTHSEINIVLCIPGPWSSRQELVERIIQNDDGYLFAGQILMDSRNKKAFEVEFEGFDETLLPAFETAGNHWKDSPEMGSIASHQSVVYLTSKRGSLETAHAIMEAACCLLKAGGFAVKVENTGLAHKASDWLEQTKYNYLFESHTSYVVYVSGDEETYSCGMHNFGLPDAIVSNSHANNPSALLKGFTLYLLSESPEIHDGQTFALDADAPIYQVLNNPSIDYGEGSLFNNPFGTWILKAQA